MRTSAQALEMALTECSPFLDFARRVVIKRCACKNNMQKSVTHDRLAAEKTTDHAETTQNDGFRRRCGSSQRILRSHKAEQDISSANTDQTALSRNEIARRPNAQESHEFKRRLAQQTEQRNQKQ